MKRTEVPGVSVEEMRRVDELAESTYHLNLLQMMENAGRCLARLTRDRFLEGDAIDKRVVVLAGPGGNGGGGMAAARRLHNWGAQVHLILGTPEQKLAPVPAHQLRALRRLEVAVTAHEAEIDAPAVLIDALLGYSATGRPRPPMDGLVTRANNSGAPILALDIPTGLNPETGEANEPAMRALATMTLALPKSGLLLDSARSYVGELWLADISIPAELYREMGIDVPVLFAGDDLLLLDA